MKEFNALASFDLQNSYLHGLIHSAKPKRRYTSKGKDSKCKKTYFYYLRIEGVLKRVCLRAFCGVHGVTVKRIRNIRGKDCSPPIDQRSKHNNRPNRTTADSVACVERHISSFPQQTSHYSRANNPNKKYLSPDLNILGIHNCGSGDGYMCMWSENVARRGSDEIASCLWNYFQSLPITRQHVIAYSDLCGGQNKKFYIVCFWIYLLLKGDSETIDHKFLTPVHTYLPSDRDFGLIQKKKKESEIYIPAQWFNLVEGTRLQKPFHVSRMKKEDFKDFKILSKSFVNTKHTVDKQKLLFQKIAWFRYTKSKPTEVLVRYSLDESEDWKVWNVGRKKANTEVALSMKYTTDNRINPKKLDDLMKMKPFIPQVYHAFYDSLKSKEVAEDSLTDIEED